MTTNKSQKVKETTWHQDRRPIDPASKDGKWNVYDNPPNRPAGIMSFNTEEEANAYVERRKKLNNGGEHCRVVPPKKTMKENKMRLSRLIETELEKAELILAAKAIPDKLQDMAEKLATIEADDMMPLLDQLKTGFGPQAADRFSQAVIGKVRELLDEVRSAKDAIETEITNLEGVANGQPVASDMGDAMSGDDMGGDDLGMDPAAAAADGAAMPPAAPPVHAAGAAPADDGLPSDEEIADADGVGTANNAAGRVRKEAMTIRGRQIESAVKKLRESKNPDAIVLAEFRANLSKHSVKEAAFRTAKTFRIDLSDVIDVVKEAKEKKKNPFGKKCPPFKGVKSKEEEKAKKVSEGKETKEDHYKGLSKWVGDYKAQRSAGNVKGAKQTKANIDAKIKEHGLDSNRVYGADPDKTSVEARYGTASKKKVTSESGDRNKKSPFRKIAEAVPQGSKSPAEMRADQQNKQANATGNQNETPDEGSDAPTNMPGKTVSSAPTNTATNPNANAPQGQQQSQQPLSPAQQAQQKAQQANSNGGQQQPQNPPQNAAGAPNGQAPNIDPTKSNQPSQGQQQPNQPNGQKQMVQSGDDGPQDTQPEDGKNLEPATQKQGFNANQNKVTMMSTTRPVPKPEHSLMGGGFGSVKSNESVMLRKYIKEFDSLGFDHSDVEKDLGLVPEKPIIPLVPEDKPEIHARLLGYIIRDNRGHTHGCKWIPDEATSGGRDEGAPKVYHDREEAHKLAKKWTEDESEHDLVMLDNIVYTVGGLYSNGETRFPA